MTIFQMSSLSGTLSVWPTNQHLKTNGAVKTRPPGFSRAATTTSWCGTTTRSLWWRRRCSCAGWACCWTTTTTPCPSTTPWTPSTYTLLTFPSCFPWLPPSWSGISLWWSCPGCPCRISWTARSSRRASVASRIHRMCLVWRAATEPMGPGGSRKSHDGFPPLFLFKLRWSAVW